MLVVSVGHAVPVSPVAGRLVAAVPDGIHAGPKGVDPSWPQSRRWCRQSSLAPFVGPSWMDDLCVYISSDSSRKPRPRVRFSSRPVPGILWCPTYIEERQRSSWNSLEKDLEIRAADKHGEVLPVPHDHGCSQVAVVGHYTNILEVSSIIQVRQRLSRPVVLLLHIKPFPDHRRSLFQNTGIYRHNWRQSLGRSPFQLRTECQIPCSIGFWRFHGIGPCRVSAGTHFAAAGLLLQCAWDIWKLLFDLYECCQKSFGWAVGWKTIKGQNDNSPQ